MAQRQPFIIVTGPGRSGTSAVARVLHESGISMGERLAAPSRHNPVGFYEEVPIRALNERIFFDAGVRQANTWCSRATALAVARPYEPDMAECARTTARGWKDPRFSLTLEAWLPHLPAPPRVIVCLRRPEAFARSAQSIFGLVTLEQLEQWWADHLRRILDIVRDYDLAATAVVFEELVSDPPRAVARLASFVDHDLDASFVEPRLRRFDGAAPARHAALHDEVRALAEQ